MPIGAYRHLVTVTHPAGGVDPPTWYCSLGTAAAQFVVDGLTSVVVRGRYHPGIQLDSQLHFEGRVFNVQSIADVDERHRELVLVCSEAVARGHSPT